MSVIEVNKNPGKGELNWFGLIFLAFLALVGAGLWFKAEAFAAAGTIWIVAGVATALYYAVPPIRRPMYLAWMYAAFPIGWVLSHLVLGIVFYLVFLPIGLIFRLVGKDPMNRSLSRDRSSDWVEHDPHGKPERYFRQF